VKDHLAEAVVGVELGVDGDRERAPSIGRCISVRRPDNAKADPTRGAEPDLRERIDVAVRDFAWHAQASSRKPKQKLARVDARVEGEGMKGDIALAGYKLTAEEWQQLDPLQRAELLAVVTHRDDRWIISGGTIVPETDGDEAK
jgi:hypothetical protein